MLAMDEFTIFIVDDDASVRDALGLTLGLHGYRTAIFASAENFLHALQPGWSGCALLDIRLGGMDGLSLQKHLLAVGSTMPVIIMTGHGDVASAREAFRAQALDFLEKPFSEERLLAAIEEARQLMTRQQRETAEHDARNKQLALLTEREREVMEHVVAGRHNREIAAVLGISTRTVEVHKARIMSKLQVGSIADLVRICLQHRGTRATQ